MELARANTISMDAAGASVFIKPRRHFLVKEQITALEAFLSGRVFALLATGCDESLVKHCGTSQLATGQ